MATKYADLLKPKATPQSKPLPGRSMVPDAAGGFVFEIDDWKRLDRFLVLGSSTGTYYANAQDHTIDNVEAVKACVAEDGVRTVARIVEISDAGRAPKNDPAIVALAVAAKVGNETTKQAAYKAMPLVCRTGTILFGFAELMEAMGGWGHGARRAVARWYLDRNTDQLAYQLVKYRQRDGWTHRDVLRLAHPKPAEGDDHGWLLRWAVGKTPEMGSAPRIVEGFEKAQHAATPKESAALITEYRLPREAVLTEHLNSIEVWDALLADMPMTAMVRNLGTMSKVGLLKPMSDAQRKVVLTLHDAQKVQRSRIHPMALLIAERTYQSGKGFRGSNTWSVVQQVVDALDDAFYMAVGNVPTTGKRFLLAIDSSGSMEYATCGGLNITPREAAAAMALITAKSEPNHYFLAYTTRAKELKISPRMRLNEATEVIQRIATGEGTDCAVPIQWASREKLNVDAIVSFTDGETWAGAVHPVQAMERYRKTMVSDARMVQVAMTATRGSLNDQGDPLALDCVGLDTSTAGLVQSFAAGEW